MLWLAGRIFAMRYSRHTTLMKVRFNTKAESNREREAAFLTLSGYERFEEFLALSSRILREYPSSVPRDYGENLVLERPAAKRSPGQPRADATGFV